MTRQHPRSGQFPQRLSRQRTLRDQANGEQLDHLCLESTWRLNMSARGVTGRPRPLKIEAAEMTGDIDDFADEIKSRDGFGLEGLGGKFRRIDAAQRHLGGPVAFGAIGPDVPLFYRGLDVQ